MTPGIDHAQNSNYKQDKLSIACIMPAKIVLIIYVFKLNLNLQ